MKAVRYDRFEGPLRLVDVPDPTPTLDGVVVKVGASGLCRSDWHGWKGHDADVKMPVYNPAKLPDNILKQLPPEARDMLDKMNKQ